VKNRSNQRDAEFRLAAAPDSGQDAESPQKPTTDSEGQEGPELYSELSADDPRMLLGMSLGVILGLGCWVGIISVGYHVVKSIW
jgi:hypothetical protein